MQQGSGMFIRLQYLKSSIFRLIRLFVKYAHYYTNIYVALYQFFLT